MKKSTLRGESGIYSILCTENGKVYIGQSKNLGRRFGEHKSSLARGVHRNPDLQADYNLYGCKAFEYTVIEKGGESLDAKEKSLIQEARASGLCYNIFDGGHKGSTPNKEWRSKVSKANSGKIVSIEQRQKMSAAARRQWENQEYRNLMISSAKRQWRDDSYREKMDKAHSGKGNAGASKLTAEMVREARRLHLQGRSLKELADMYGVLVCTIGNAVSGRTWAYVI